VASFILFGHTLYQIRYIRLMKPRGFEVTEYVARMRFANCMQNFNLKNIIICKINFKLRNNRKVFYNKVLPCYVLGHMLKDLIETNVSFWWLVYED
jgi:hypothetical protein